ncbi:neural cell adhesion molecule 2-like [Ischnura elegans]|uniref:neural cell adhesion molecule 2-like n=1 Tax=Ischnura elegans TaxID=197161 RepID=UPI001ED87AB5|nr:neural cell adhesion molecule 2-like [Ischnura elegans]
MKKGKSIVAMEKMDLFCVALLASCLISGEASPDSAALAKAASVPLILYPSQAEVVKDVNESYIVSCQSDKGLNLRWTFVNANGTSPITQSKGRVHVEENRKERGVRLIFENIEKRDMGLYTCSASIDNQEAKESFKLIVIKPITFVDTPPVQVAKEHSSIVVRCEAKGEPEPTVVWTVKGKTPKAPKFQIVGDGLFIENVTLEDRGEYQCRAYQTSKVAGSMKEQTITLKIQHKPTWKSQYRGNDYEEGEQENNVNGEGSSSQAWGYVGGVVNLTCEAIAEPEATFHWLKDNKTIMPDEDSEVFNMKHRSVLQLAVHDESAFGGYVCKASNSLGTLERVVVLQKGTKPGAPTAVIRGASADSIHLEIHPPQPSNHHHHNVDHGHEHHELPIIGYRVQWKREKDQGWAHANAQDFVKDGAYIISGLSSDTSYLVRVAARNAAGVGDYAKELYHRTGKITADSVTGESTSSALSIHVPPNFIFHLLLQVMLLTIPLVSCRDSLSVNL